MIEEEYTIRFRPGDVPDLPELGRPEARPPRRGIPEPEDWKPHGEVW